MLDDGHDVRIDSLLRECRGYFSWLSDPGSETPFNKSSRALNKLSRTIPSTAYSAWVYGS